MLSDARRKLMKVLIAHLEGHTVPTWKLVESLTSSTAEDPENIVGELKGRVDTPLTPHQKTAFNFLLARLLEVEGLHGQDLAGSYAKASFGIMEQLSAMQPIFVVQSMQLAKQWMERAVALLDKARGVSHPKKQAIQELRASPV